MLKTLFLFLITCACLSANAQYSGYHSVSELDNFKKQFAAQSQKINTVTSNFTQKKTLIALTESITSEGVFYFKRANKVRLEYKKPFQYLMVMNTDRMMVQDDGRENTVNLKSNKLFQQINRIVLDCVQGTILDSKDFTSRIFENQNGYLLEMTPTAKNLKAFFQTIILTVAKKDGSVESITMNEPAGDSTVITFSDKKLNAPVPDDIFTF